MAKETTLAAGPCPGHRILRSSRIGLGDSQAGGLQGHRACKGGSHKTRWVHAVYFYLQICLKSEPWKTIIFSTFFFFLHKIEMLVLPCGSSEPLPLCSWHTLPFSLGVGHIALQGDLRQSCSLLNIRLENIGE